MTATCVAYDPIKGKYLVELGNKGTIVYTTTRAEADAIADDWLMWEAHATHQWRTALTKMLGKVKGGVM